MSCRVEPALSRFSVLQVVAAVLVVSQRPRWAIKAAAAAVAAVPSPRLRCQD